MIISLEENNHDIVMAVAKKALAHTPQLLVRSQLRPEEPMAFASGLFVRWKERPFLLTAGHCVQDENGNAHKVGIMIKRHFHALSGHTWAHANPKIDLGFILLSEQSENACASVYPFFRTFTSVFLCHQGQ
jgi:hypothetical protein